jgi:hypothetical protein
MSRLAWRGSGPSPAPHWRMSFGEVAVLASWQLTRGRPRPRLGDISRRQTSNVYEERPPICSACGVTMVPAELSARTPRDHDWICLECEETDELDADSWPHRPM